MKLYRIRWTPNEDGKPGRLALMLAAKDAVSAIARFAVLYPDVDEFEVSCDGQVEVVAQ